jgi:CubicO group peptidase (beta-lactamase class C family)
LFKLQNSWREKMKSSFRVGVLVLTVYFWICTPLPSAENDSNASWEGFKEFVEDSLMIWNVPGLAMAVVVGNDVVFSLGVGVRDIESKAPVSTETLFAIGSTTKSFTATLAGILVDEGKVDWDAPVITYLPWIRLKDKLTTERLTLRDLLSHRSGVPDHTLAWYTLPSTRGDLIKRLQYLKPTADFRTQFQYNNLGITAAGYILGHVYGRSWEELILEKIFQPLDMKCSGFFGSALNIKEIKNFALPHTLKNGTIEMLRLSPAYESVGPAGSIISNVLDMAKWLSLHLKHGTFKGRKIVSKDILQETYLPVVAKAEISVMDKTTWHGMGWFIEPSFLDERRLSHSGGLEGYKAYVSFIPEADAGIVVLTNMDGTLLPYVVADAAYSKLFRREGKNWNTYWQTRARKLMESAAADLDADRVIKINGTLPAHPFEEYAGKFENPGYGHLHIECVQNLLKASLNGTVHFELKHLHYEVFTVANIDAPGREYAVYYIGTAKLVFITDLSGHVNQVKLIYVPGSGDETEVVFARILQ